MKTALKRCILSLFMLQALSVAWSCVAAQDSVARPLTNGDSASRAPSWSPDGARIAFESDRSGKWNLHVLDVETGTVERLTHANANDRYPAWSPDGERLVFVSDRNGETDLHTLDLRTGQVTRLVAAPGDELFPEWFPDGRKIVFTRQLADSTTIRSVGFDETPVDPVLNTIGHGIWPRWSADGKRLAFFSRRDTRGQDDEVYLFDYLSGDVTRLTSRPGHDFCPSWSPKGDRLVMVSIEPDGSRSLRIVNDKGEEEARHAQDFHRVTEPTWSPDGAFIVYAGIRREGQAYQLFLEPVPRRFADKRMQSDPLSE